MLTAADKLEVMVEKDNEANETAKMDEQVKPE